MVCTLPMDKVLLNLTAVALESSESIFDVDGMVDFF
jgi:hypothetical protein